MGAALPPTVFISYSHDSEAHEQRVLALADQLRANGIDVRLDQYVAHPPEGWPRWCERQAVECTFVLMVCTPTYRQRFDREDTPGDAGKGAKFEGLIIQQILFEAGTINRTLIPVVFDDGDAQDVPLSLRAYARYRVPREYDALYRRLTDQPKTPAPPLGELKVMPPAERPGLMSMASTKATSRAGSTTMARVTDHEVVDELAKVLGDEGRARVVLERVNFPLGQIPAFRMPLVFWSAVVGDARNGVIEGGVRALVEVAVTLARGNAVFERYLAQ